MNHESTKREDEPPVEEREITLEEVSRSYFTSIPSVALDTESDLLDTETRVVPTPPVTNLRAGIFIYVSGIVGPNGQDRDLLVKGTLAPPDILSVTSPRVILTQPRQGDNNEFGFADQFAIQITETGRDFIRFRIRRIDTGSNSPRGWGQNLRVDFLIVDDGTE